MRSVGDGFDDFCRRSTAETDEPIEAARMNTVAEITLPDDMSQAQATLVRVSDGSNLLGWNDSLPFQNSVELVCCQVLDDVSCT